MKNTQKENKRWGVGAFDGGEFAYLASIAYSERESAEIYCMRCNEECSPKTHKTYKVIELADDEEDIHD